MGGANGTYYHDHWPDSVEVFTDAPGCVNPATEPYVSDTGGETILPDGYWLGAGNGDTYMIDHQYYGSAPNLYPAPITAMAGTPDHGGYWVLDASGGANSFGDAKQYGGGRGTGERWVAMTPTPDGKGYWLAASNGDIRNFGDAPDV